MSNRQDKPKMSAADLVKKMRDEKGITFNLVSEAEAERYLSDINNYFRTASYRKNYQTYQRGENQGKYINLDFAHLQELAAIDLAFRHAVTSVCLDIEHDLKLTMLADIDNSTQDGYSLVKQFLSQNPYVVDKLSGMSASAFTSDIMQKYFTITRSATSSRGRITSYDDCPAWVLFEFLSFGDLIRFYSFFYNAAGKKHLTQSALNAVRSLRNGCAHNTCMLANMNPGNTFAPLEVTNYVSGISGISTSQRQKRLTCRPIAELASLLYVYRELTSQKNTHGSMNTLLELLFVRMTKNKDFFLSNDLIVRNYDFTTKVAKDMFPELTCRYRQDG